MISNKDQIIDQVRQSYQKDQYRWDHFNPSFTKLGPCMQQYGKFVFSSWTKSQEFPESYINNMLTLGEKYKDIGYLPLNLPKIKLENFSLFEEIWNKENIEIKKTDDTNEVPEYKGMHITSNCLLDFNLHDLYVDGKMSKTQISTSDGYTQGRNIVGRYTKKLYKHKIFFNLISEIMDSFPIAQISNMLILETITDIAPHREQSWTWKCPTEFRILLHDENTEPTFYVSNIQTGYTEYIDLPDDTNSFCWSNGNYIYGIDYHAKKQYQLIVNAIWSPNKLDRLIENSIEKYRK